MAELHPGVQVRVLRRDRAGGWLGGVCAGIARHYGFDAMLVRLAFVVTAAAGGLGLALYAVAWLVIPAGDAPAGARRRLPTGRSAVQVALGTGLLLLSALLTMRALGLWFSDAIVWPLVLVASGGALIWRQAVAPTVEPEAPPSEALMRPRPPAPAPEEVPARSDQAQRAPAEVEAERSGADAGVALGGGPGGTALGGGSGATAARTGSGATALGAGSGATAARAGGAALGFGGGAARGGAGAVQVERRLASISRTGLGVVLVIAAAVAFLQATGALGAIRDVLLATLAVVVVLGVILAPWILRLARSLAAERSQRIRSQERAEVAAHLHDSVLQTLALVQRRAGEPAEVAALARRQERELRAWLAGRPAPGAAARLAAALEAVAADVEERHGVPVEVVTVGDRELDPPAEAVVAAAREAMTNAAKFGGGSTVDVYAEAGDGRLQVFVRDRGPGFDPGAVPGDRRGLRESIVGRMERNGGRATVTSSPGTGTEVELVVEERER